MVNLHIPFLKEASVHPFLDLYLENYANSPLEQIIPCLNKNLTEFKKC